MLPSTIISIFVFLVILLIFFEYRNEKKYQEKRREKRQKPISTQRTPPAEKPKKVAPKPTPSQEPEPKEKPEPIMKAKPEPEIKEDPKPEPKKEVTAETKELPEANYPHFTHVRLIEMGLSDDEAKEFVGELIPQLETEIPLIDAAIQEEDFQELERLIHGIKGSANNLGTGGVSDLLSDYNTYVKTGTDTDIAKAYLEHLRHYTKELKAQYA